MVLSTESTGRPQRMANTVAELVEANGSFVLSAKNPNKKEETALREPKEILEEMKRLDGESQLIMENLKLIIENGK